MRYSGGGGGGLCMYFVRNTLAWRRGGGGFGLHNERGARYEDEDVFSLFLSFLPARMMRAKQATVLLARSFLSDLFARK